MISRIKGRLIKKEKDHLVLEVGGIFYEVDIPPSVYNTLNKEIDAEVELVVYHYLNIEKNRGFPVMIGFLDDLQKEFFEKFITVSGIGPKSALRAFEKPIGRIAQAIEEADINFLSSLDGIGKQRAKQIVAYLQGKVGRFALLKEPKAAKPVAKKETVEEARQILRRLQYGVKEIEEMIKKALEAKPQIESIEDLLNEIYRQRK